MLINELIKALKDFIVRDIIYIIGGVSVILCLLYAFGKICDVFGKEPSVVVILYIAAIGYVIGWLIQDMSALILGNLMTTSLNYKPGTFIQKRHLKFISGKEKDCWKGIPDENFDEIEASIKINKEEGRNLAQLERFVCLMQIGTTIGPCWFVSGVILFFKSLLILLHVAILCEKVSCRGCVLCVFAVIVLLISVGLMILGRIQLVQLERYTYAIYKQPNDESQQEKTTESSQESP